MKASELIERLQELIKNYGDRVIYDTETGLLKFDIDLNK